MKHIQYRGKLWTSRFKEYDPSLLGLLKSKDCLIVLSHGKPPYRVILGVPHQAAVGEAYICEKGKRRDSDENAAGYALVVYSLLKEHDIPCKLVIMAHSTVDDPNKNLSTPYCQEVFGEPAELFFECHGAGGGRDYDLELSAGRNPISHPTEFARSLAGSLQHGYDLAAQEKHGETFATVFLKGGGEKKGVLQNPGTGTISLVEAGKRNIPALHLEAKPKFRKSDGKKDGITDDSFVLGRGIAQTILKGWVLDELRNVEKSYEAQVRNMTGAYYREIARTKEYQGRQLLELLQNADDEAEKTDNPTVLIRLEDNRLVVANNGSPFSREGILSLMYSDTSPKIKRKKKIGYKGLGFRAILNWSESIGIKSGAFSLEFSKPNAVAFLEKLLEKNSNLKDAIRETSTTEYPIATLAVPSWKDIQSKEPNDYETYIVINFTSDQIRNDIQGQINQLGMEVALFLNNIRGIRLESQGRNETIVRIPSDSGGFEEIRLLDNEGNIIKSKKWRIFDEPGELPGELRKDEMARQFEYDLRIAVSENMDDTINRLFCYFQTEVKFPFPAIIHGTFDLDGNRTHLNDNAVNKFLLERLAELMTDTAKKLTQADQKISWDALKLLAKRGEYDDKVEKMEFPEKLLASIKKHKLIPVLSDKYMSAEERPVFYDIRLADILKTATSDFPELALYTADKEIHDLIHEIGVGRYNPEQLVKKLNRVSPSLSLEQRADLILMMVDHYDKCLRPLRADKIPSLFIDEQGKVIGSNTKALLPPERSKFQLPEIVRIVFISNNLFNQLRAKAGIKTGRALAEKLTPFNVNEYRFDTVIGRIIAVTNRAIKKNKLKKNEYLKKMMESLFLIFSDDSDPDKKFPEHINVPLLTSKGELRSARELYFGRAYSVGKVMDALYSEIDDTEFVASKEELGLSTTNENEAVRFLKWVGVEQYPRIKPKTLEKEIYNPEYEDYVLRNIKFPYQTTMGDRYGTYEELRSDKTARSRITIADIAELDLILEKARFEDILAWLHLDPRIQTILREGHEPANSSFGLWLHKKQYLRNLSYVDISAYLIWKLRNTKWVKTRAGKKDAPTQCCLSETLDGMSPLIEVPDINVKDKIFKDNRIQRRDVEYVLTKIGASEDFSHLPTETVYGILSRLETADPEGEKAKNIYTKIIQGKPREWAKGVVNEESRNTFIKKGTILVKNNGKNTYLPVKDAYYVDNLTFCREIMNKFPIVQIPRRQGKEQVREIFGVRPLEDIKFDLISQPENHPINAQFSRHFEKFKPYVLVFRLDKPTFTTEMNQLKKLKICLCTRLETKYQFDNTEGELNLNPYEHVQPAGENTAYLLVEPTKQYKDMADLKKDKRLCDALAEIISGVLKVDENRKDYRELFAAERQERDDIIQSDLDDPTLQTLKEVRNRLKDVTDVQKEFWQNILLTKGIEEDLFEIGQKEETIPLLSKQLGIEETLIREVFEAIDYENLSKGQNLTHIKKLFNALGITVRDFNLHASEEIDFSKDFESEVTSEKFRLLNKLQIYLYHALKDKDIKSKEEFITLLNTYKSTSFTEQYDINKELSSDMQKCFDATFQKEPFTNLTQTYSNLLKEERASLDEVYNKNRNDFLQKIEQSGGAYAEDIASFLENSANKSLLYFGEHEELIRRFETKYPRPPKAVPGRAFQPIISKKKITLNGKEEEYEEDDYGPIIKSMDEDFATKVYNIVDYNPQRPSDSGSGTQRTRTGGSRTQPPRKHTKEIGLIGEYYVYRALVNKYGADKVFWISENAKMANINPQGSDSEGYDIRYINENNQVRYVEVKSSSSDESTFQMSPEEVKFAEKHATEYELIFVANVLTETRRMNNLGNIFNYPDDESFNNNSRFSVENDGFRIRFQI
jgi:hypothetical protein